ncbi:transposase [Hoeflea sp. EC-HK425]|uniref:transposase n=1 Tax=Hoeflea sp. EC-HK425 TaxID=2038388 RepID=UPI00125FD6AD|nr:transposase [Hoeflea sp. EC-HK425]
MTNEFEHAGLFHRMRVARLSDVVCADVLAARRGDPRTSIDEDLLDLLMKGRTSVDLIGKTGALAGLTKAPAERTLSTEIDAHLDEVRIEEVAAEGNQRSNRRNCSSRKMVTTDSRKVVLDISGDGNSTLYTMSIAKYQRRLTGWCGARGRPSYGNTKTYYVCAIRSDRLAMIALVFECRHCKHGVLNR